MSEAAYDRLFFIIKFIRYAFLASHDRKNHPKTRSFSDPGSTEAQKD